ncbi:MAG: TolC family protein [Acidobacteriota bacterium]
MKKRSGLRLLTILVAMAGVSLQAQPRQIAVQPPDGPPVIRSYQAPEIPPIRLNNSPRLSSVLRAGQMYLTLQDAVALAIENNLGLESSRYGPLLSDWALKRDEAGGPIRGVPSASAQVSSVNSGVGVSGTIASAGLGGGGGGGGGGNNGGVVVQQIGQVVPNLDPILQNSTTFSHLTQPQANTAISQTTALVQDERTYNTVFQQGLLTGGYFQLRDYSQYFKENAPSDVLNPVNAPHADIYFRHNLLKGFGVKLNSRSIRIAQMNVRGSAEVFRSEVIDLVASVSHLYWDLVTANDVTKARQAAVDIAQKFYEDTKARIGAGALAPIELPRAAAELASRQEDLLIAQTTARQQENRLKEAFTRSEDPAIESAGILPLDKVRVPDSDTLPPVRELVAAAMKKRPDVAIAKIRDQAAELNAIGTTNPLLPTLVVTAQTFNRGVAGTPQASGGQANPFFVGGNGTALGQIFRRNFPNESASVSIQAPLGNRQAQADYGIDQLQLRQSAVQGQRSTNQIAVDISNQVIALRQARARYTTAVNTRELQEQLLQAEQEKFSFGKTTITGLITTQRALVTARTAEINALATYAHARVSLDQVLGDTLETNHVSMDQAMDGHVETP